MIRMPEGANHRLYFAYGEDMHPDVIGERCAAPFAAGIGTLDGFRLDFHGHTARWDGGQETLVKDPRAKTWGVLYKLDFGDSELLDGTRDTRLDGTGVHYHLPVEVDMQDGSRVVALTYVLSQRGLYRFPSAEYVNLIAEAGRMRGFPRAYVERLQSQPCGPASYPVPKGSGTPRGGDCPDCTDWRDEIRRGAEASAG